MDNVFNAKSCYGIVTALCFWFIACYIFWGEQPSLEVTPHWFLKGCEETPDFLTLTHYSLSIIHSK